MKIVSHILLLFGLTLFFFAPKSEAQIRRLNSAELLQSIKKLNVLGSVLYVAAHPDDENTNLISYLANDRNVNIRYLSLTRGDGGQNLIGSEQQDFLGAIRTQELLRARGIDGGKQAFSRANDFGYSKNPEETLRFWDKQKVLSDVVWAIRKYQPDVVINRFDHTTARPNHGHHTASAQLSNEAFDLAANPAVFPEQLKYVSVWQPKRLLMNVSWWWYGGKDKFEKVDKSNMLKMDLGVYYPFKGKSNTEIAAESRSQHRCQGMGTLPERGAYAEYFEHLKGEKASADVIDGINMTWSRVENGGLIDAIIREVIQAFDYNNPSASVPKLLEAQRAIEALPEGYWKKIKLEEINEVIRQCMGLYLEATAADYSVTPGEALMLNIEATNRSNVNATLKSIEFLGAGKDTTTNLVLDFNKAFKFKTQVIIPANTPYTAPYWINSGKTVGMYNVEDQNLIGLPETPRALRAKFTVEIKGRTLTFIQDIAHRFEDNAKGEMYRPLEVLPAITSKINEKVFVFDGNTSKTIQITVKAGRAKVEGKVMLNAPSDWKVSPTFQSFNIKQKGEEQIFNFSVIPPSYSSETTANVIANIDGQLYKQEQSTISYDHIPTQTILHEASAKMVKVTLQKRGNTIGYMMGAGDEVPNCLRQVGYNVTLLQDADITSESLKKYDAIVLGIRAYNTVERMKFYQPKLMDYVKEGGTLISQYNNSFELYVPDTLMTPYRMTLSRDRVTDEAATMRMLDPTNVLLNKPNPISQQDFEGWIQERGLYFPNTWDKEKFTPVLGCNDMAEPSKDGALLLARYGKGFYIYTPLAFFRQLPGGVPGAYKLFTNMLSVGKVRKED